MTDVKCTIILWLVAWERRSKDTALFRNSSLEAVQTCTLVSQRSAVALSFSAQVVFQGHFWGKREIGDILHYPKTYSMNVCWIFKGNIHGRLSQGILLLSSDLDDNWSRSCSWILEHEPSQCPVQDVLLKLCRTSELSRTRRWSFSSLTPGLNVQVLRLGILWVTIQDVARLL